MKFVPSFNIWEVPVALLAKAQAGQWVYAGDKTCKGVFLGVKPSGSIVVAWYSISKNQKNFRDHIKNLRAYAKG
jgi:hypothetical protein